MTRSRSFALLSLALGLSLLGCSKSSPPAGTGSPPASQTASQSPSPTASESPSPTRGPRTFTETESANGKTISVIAGDKIVVKLESNESTGYSWQVSRAPSSAVLRQTRATYSPTPHPAMQVGSGGYQYFQYDVVGAGSTSMSFRYAGPDGTTAKTFTLSVRSA